MGADDCFALIAEWVTLLGANDLGAATIRQYTYALYRLADSTGFRVHLLEMTEGHIALFLASLGDKASSKEHYAKGIRSFYDWAVHRGYLLTSPVGLIRPRKVHRAPPERFEIDELVRLLIAAAWRDPRRGWAILSSLALGTRRSEFVGIRCRDIDWERRVVVLRCTKGRRPREVDIGPWAAEALGELFKLSAGDRLLPIAPNTFTMWVHEAAKDCGFPPGRKQRSHTLRSTFASMLADDNVPIQVVSRLLGHQSVSTTTAYLSIGRRHDTREAVQVMGGAIAFSAEGV
jgi:integrase